MIEYTDENTYVVLSDVVVETELLGDDIVKITLTNTSIYDINKWMVAYEALYDIITIENAEIILNNRVKEVKALPENQLLQAGENVIITLKIDGSYDNTTEYRVYGLCDGISEDLSVVDCVSYDVATGITSLVTVDYESMMIDTSDVVYTRSLDIATTDMNSLTNVVAPQSIIPDEECMCPSNCICIRIRCTCEGVCDCIFDCACDARTQVSNVNVAPYNKIAFLLIDWSNGDTTMGTGFLINSKHMLTAAHCLYDPSRGTVESIRVHFGAKGYEWLVCLIKEGGLMRNKKTVWIFIFVALTMLIMSVVVLKQVGFFEETKVLEASGNVVRISDKSIQFGAYLIGVDRNTHVIDSDGNRSDVRKIQVGQRILVRFTGDMLETNPAQLTEIVEIEILEE